MYVIYTYSVTQGVEKILDLFIFVLILVLKSKFPFSIFGLRPFIKIETSRIVFLLIHNLHMWFFGACPTPGGRGLVGGLMENWEGKTSLGALGEVAEERGRRPDSFSKVLPIGGPGDAPFWCVNLDLDGNNAAKTGGGTHGFLAAGGGNDGSKSGIRHVTKGGEREGAPDDRDKASLVIHRYEAGEGSGVGSPATNIKDLCKGDGVRGWGEGARAVVASDSRITASEDHTKRYFGSSKGEVATGIWRAWRGRGRVGRVGLWW